MKIVNGYPPNYKQIKAVLRPTELTIFTYGDTIYNPTPNDIPDHLMVHEQTHSIRQGDDPAGWWKRYLVDSKFRVDEELAAYKNQYRKYLKHHDRNAANLFCMKIARDLSSALYGNILSFSEAFDLIKK